MLFFLFERDGCGGIGQSGVFVRAVRMYWLNLVTISGCAAATLCSSPMSLDRSNNSSGFVFGAFTAFQLRQRAACFCNPSLSYSQYRNRSNNSDWSLPNSVGEK